MVRPTLMQKPKYARDFDKLVLVQRTVLRQGREVNQKQWVAGDKVKPSDEILKNAHNVKPYRYSRRNLPAPAPAPLPVPAQRGHASPLSRLSVALFTEILAAQKAKQKKD